MAAGSRPRKQEISMRIVLIGLAVLTVILPANVELASAQPRPWCLQSGRGGPGGGLPDCTYYTLQQCLASRGGGTDGCMQNPAIGWDRIEGKRYAQPPRSGARVRGY
ncbi:MAG: DUF3551 domain-containing protein [Rhizobiales bacterium]|nr:DUF3551 domain-containing protein [Hyphomicrobiales bacterium]